MNFITLYLGIILLSANGLFSKTIPLDATSITQLRSVIAVIAIVVFLSVLKRPLHIANGKKQLGVYGLGLLMGLHWVTYFHAMQVSTIAIGMLSLYTFPVITIFLEGMVNKEKISWKDLLSAVFILVGILVMTGGDIDIKQSSTLQGIFWGLASAVFFSSRNVLQKYYFSDIPSINLMLFQLIAIAVALLFFIDFSAVTSLPASSWLQLVTMGLVTTAAAHTFLVTSYKRLPAKTVAMVSCLQPAVGAFLAWLVLRELISMPIVIGGAIILSVAVYESVAQIKSSDR